MPRVHTTGTGHAPPPLTDAHLRHVRVHPAASRRGTTQPAPAQPPLPPLPPLPPSWAEVCKCRCVRQVRRGFDVDGVRMARGGARAVVCRARLNCGGTRCGSAPLRPLRLRHRLPRRRHRSRRRRRPAAAVAPPPPSPPQQPLRPPSPPLPSPPPSPPSPVAPVGSGTTVGPQCSHLISSHLISPPPSAPGAPLPPGSWRRAGGP